MGKRSVIPFGPQHPVLPEPLHLSLAVEDEHVIQAIPQMGFIHRGLEKLTETHDYKNYVYVAERICGICSFGHSLGYCETIEQMKHVEVPVRAQKLRVMLHEISRIQSHLLWLGLTADAFGFESLFMHVWRIREKILDIFDMTTGGRIILSINKVGGLVHDIDDDVLENIKTNLTTVLDEYQQIKKTFLANSSVKSRCCGVGVISHEEAEHLGMVGPFARASYVNNDVRCLGIGGYHLLSNFRPILDSDGDCYARIRVRSEEVVQSIRIACEMIDSLEPGNISVDVKGPIPQGIQAANLLEQPRGECFYYALGNGTNYLERMRMRTPSSENLAGMLHALKGCDLADVNMIILTIDPCISCTER